jgi:hypothetical protein
MNSLNKILDVVYICLLFFIFNLLYVYLTKETKGIVGAILYILYGDYK